MAHGESWKLCVIGRGNVWIEDRGLRTGFVDCGQAILARLGGKSIVCENLVVGKQGREFGVRVSIADVDDLAVRLVGVGPRGVPWGGQGRLQSPACYIAIYCDVQVVALGGGVEGGPDAERDEL